VESCEQHSGAYFNKYQQLDFIIVVENVLTGNQYGETSN
jgi:hypothetical protein